MFIHYRIIFFCIEYYFFLLNVIIDNIIILQTKRDFCISGSISGLTFGSLHNIDLEALEIPFPEEKVLAALSSLSGDKALGLDDFLTFLLGFCEKGDDGICFFFFFFLQNSMI